MNNPSIWNPAASATDGVANLTYLSGVSIPVPEDGVLVFVVDTGGGPGSGFEYQLSLTSGAPVDGFNVVSTFLGGPTRWLRRTFGGSGIAGVVVQNGGVPIANNPKSVFNFIGAGGTAFDAGGPIANIFIPGGAAVTEEVTQVPFSFLTPSPLTLTMLNPLNAVNRAIILITTPFDDPTATLMLGTPGSPGLFLGATQNIPGANGQYETGQLSQFFAPDFLRLTITPNASTQGAGLLLYKLKR